MHSMQRALFIMYVFFVSGQISTKNSFFFVDKTLSGQIGIYFVEKPIKIAIKSFTTVFTSNITNGEQQSSFGNVIYLSQDNLPINILREPLNKQ